MSLGDRIKQSRKHLGQTQAGLASLCGIAKETLRDLEAGKTRSTSSTNLLRLAETLGKTPEWLERGEQLDEPARLSSNEQHLLAVYRKLSAKDRLVVDRILVALAAP